MFTWGPQQFGAAVPTDPFFANVVLLLNFDELTVVDQSLVPKSPGTASGISFETVAPLAGAASVISTSSELIYPPSTAFSRPSVYTLEFRIKRTTGQPGGFLMSRSAGRYLALSGMDLVVQGYGGGSTIPLTSGVNHHIALCSDGTTHRFFRDGVLISTGAPDAASVSAESFAVLGVPGRPDLLGPGIVLDTVRLTQNVARYTANFTPPTAQLPDVGP